VESALVLLVVFSAGMRSAVRDGYRLPFLSTVDTRRRLGSWVSYQGRTLGHASAAPICLHWLFLTCVKQRRTSYPNARDKLWELNDRTINDCLTVASCAFKKFILSECLSGINMLREKLFYYKIYYNCHIFLLLIIQRILK